MPNTILKFRESRLQSKSAFSTTLYVVYNYVFLGFLNLDLAVCVKDRLHLGNYKKMCISVVDTSSPACDARQSSTVVRLKVALYECPDVGPKPCGRGCKRGAHH